MSASITFNSQSLIPIAQGTLPVLLDMAATMIVQKRLSTKASYAVSSLVGCTTLLAFCTSTEKQILGSGLVYLAYKTVRFIVNYQANLGKSPRPKESSSKEKSNAQEAPAPVSSKDTISDIPASATSPADKPKVAALTTASIPTPRTEEERNRSASEISQKMEALTTNFTFPFEHKLVFPDEKTPSQIADVLYAQKGFAKAELDARARYIWSKITGEFDGVLKMAAAEMMMLLLDVKLGTKNITDKEEKNRAMANLLNSDPRYTKHFCVLNTKTLFRIYRYARGMRFIIHCPHVKHKDIKPPHFIFFSVPLSEGDCKAFMEPGTQKNEWRSLYNQVIEAYKDLIPYLSPESQKWFIKDEGTKAFVIVPK